MSPLLLLRASVDVAHAVATPAALLAGLFLPGATFGQEIAATAPTKDHVLFVGTDLAVKEGKETYRVVGAKKDSLQIEKGHGFAYVRLGQGANIKVSRGVKLSSLSATISEIKTESVDHASARAQLAAMQAAMTLTDETRDNEDRLHGVVTLLSANVVRPHPEFFMRGRESFDNVQRIQAETTAAYVSALPALDQLATSTNTLLTQNIMKADPISDEVTLDASDLPGLKLLGGSATTDSALGGTTSGSSAGANASSGTAEVELTFNVSSPVPLDNAYIVVVANYGSSSRPDEVARQISTKEFGHIDSQPRRVKMTHAASINGRPFRKFEMGLYANGQEVATNLSEKRLALTSDQAFQFFLIDYLSTHKGATLPPAPVLMIPRTEFHRQVATTDANQTIHANVDKQGNVMAISADAAGAQKVSPSVDAALRNIRFMPALDHGTPVDGQVKMTLAQLTK